MTDAYVVNVDAAVYRLRGGEPRYLLIERGAAEDHAPGSLGLPGGTLEAAPGDADAIESTLRRELREEVAVEAGDTTLVTSGVFELDTGEPCLNVVLLAEHESGDPHPADPEEVAAVHWYDLDGLREDDAVPAFTRGYVEAAEETRTAGR
ncbi:NUDIX hydrolase [Halobaculum sp. EA56]|uniref:NUDIX hydrolase n=1 Tax=Halobaculum sp. EA56 TaxID=3421648 RepID=UPI003EBEA3BA